MQEKRTNYKLAVQPGGNCVYAAMAYRHPRDTRESSFPFQRYSMGEAENFTRVSLEEEKREKKMQILIDMQRKLESTQYWGGT